MPTCDPAGFSYCRLLERGGLRPAVFGHHETSDQTTQGFRGHAVRTRSTDTQYEHVVRTGSADFGGHVEVARSGVVNTAVALANRFAPVNKVTAANEIAPADKIAPADEHTIAALQEVLAGDPRRRDAPKRLADGATRARDCPHTGITCTQHHLHTASPVHSATRAESQEIKAAAPGGPSLQASPPVHSPPRHDPPPQLPSGASPTPAVL